MQLTKKSLLQTWHSKNLSIALFAYFLIAVIATAQGLFAGPKTYVPGGHSYISYNNFRIFKLSFYHLLQGKDIYQLFPDEHWDLYKYSPAFALCFGVLSWMPDSIGLLLWNLINSLCLFFGIRLLPGLSDEKKSWILLFSLLEMLLSIQNTQSNGLMAGLIVLAFALAERSKYALSTLCIVFSFYIKIYGVLAFVFYLFYPGKLRLAGWSIFWMILFALLPLVVVNTHQLGFLYHSWFDLLMGDRSASMGVSLMGIMDTWFHLAYLKNSITLIGLLLFLLPLIHINRYKDYTFRLLYLASVLIWMVIFNHKAESPTFVIVTAGIGIWYFSQHSDLLNRVLLILSFFLISMSVSDLVPAPVRDHLIRPYGIKAVMGIVVWLKIFYEQITLRYRSLPSITADAAVI
ncbi:MAG TPA: glycosyltransferase family 87 protein [Puia sp.]|nr:glycosyltransferase family 87 protein [Puia sp.]